MAPPAIKVIAEFAGGQYLSASVSSGILYKADGVVVDPC